MPNNFDVGYEDYWHYNEPRQPHNSMYMEGWQTALLAEIEDIEADSDSDDE